MNKRCHAASFGCCTRRCGCSRRRAASTDEAGLVDVKYDCAGMSGVSGLRCMQKGMGGNEHA